LDYARASRIVARYADRAVEVIPPVDPERFAPAPSGDLRARLGVRTGPVVGFVGRIVFEKGLPVLVQAMRLLRERHPDATLIVAGEGAAVAGGGVLAGLAREVADDPGVVLTGFLPEEDLPALYSMCDVLALPSIDPLEAFGMVQVEAMLCGCPVVASDLPGVRLPVARTGMGVLVPPGDPDRLAEALAELIDTPERFRVPHEEVARVFDPRIAFAAFAGAVAEAAGR
jgi:glycosyltransferase involved in cell wall biosynthesis